MGKEMKIIHKEQVKRTIRAYSDIHGNKCLEIVEFETIPQIKEEQKHSKLEIFYMISMCLIGYGVGFNLVI